MDIMGREAAGSLKAAMRVVLISLMMVMIITNMQERANSVGVAAAAAAMHDDVVISNNSTVDHDQYYYYYYYRSNATSDDEHTIIGIGGGGGGGGGRGDSELGDEKEEMEVQIMEEFLMDSEANRRLLYGPYNNKDGFSYRSFRLPPICKAQRYGSCIGDKANRGRPNHCTLENRCKIG